MSQNKVIRDSRKEVDLLTLKYMTNRELCCLKETKKDIPKFSNKDRRFYKKRIFEFIKTVLKGGKIPESLQSPTDIFMTAIIDYFRIEDTRDIIQEEYKGLKTKTTSEETLYRDMVPIDKMNELITSTNGSEVNLDKFVCKIDETRDTIDMPIKKSIKLDDPILRTKGIQKKGKNQLK
jgi:hypothetical protein